MRTAGEKVGLKLNVEKMTDTGVQTGKRKVCLQKTSISLAAGSPGMQAVKVKYKESPEWEVQPR